jgi:hypothetical protein
MASEELSRLWDEFAPPVRSLRQLSRDPGASEQVREMLADLQSSRMTLYALCVMDTDVILSLLPELVSIGQGQANAVLVRQILGRLSRLTLEDKLVPVIRAAAISAQDDEYRRLLELATHLGLEGILRELAANAVKSDDPDIREAGADFLDRL